MALSDRSSIVPEDTLLTHAGVYNAPILSSQSLQIGSKQISALLYLATSCILGLFVCLLVSESSPPSFSDVH